MWPQRPCSCHSAKHCLVSTLQAGQFCVQTPLGPPGGEKLLAMACVPAPNLFCSENVTLLPPNSLTGNSLDVCSSFLFDYRSLCDNAAILCKFPMEVQPPLRSFLGFPRGSYFGFQEPQRTVPGAQPTSGVLFLALSRVRQGHCRLNEWSLAYCVNSLRSGEPWKIIYFVLMGTEQKLCSPAKKGSPARFPQERLCETLAGLR